MALWEAARGVSATARVSTKSRAIHSWDLRPISYSKSGADGRIRTGDPLFTKQLLCQLSYVGAAPRLYEGYEVATVVCAGSSALIVIWLTGTLSLRNVVTKVLRVGSHQVIR